MGCMATRLLPRLFLNKERDHKVVVCVEFAYHTTGILAILDFQNSLYLSLDGGLLEMYIKLSFFGLYHISYCPLLLYFVYLFQASLSSSLEVFVLSQLRSW